MASWPSSSGSCSASPRISVVAESPAAWWSAFHSSLASSSAGSHGTAGLLSSEPPIAGRAAVCLVLAAVGVFCAVLAIDAAPSSHSQWDPVVPRARGLLAALACLCEENCAVPRGSSPRLPRRCRTARHLSVRPWRRASCLARAAYSLLGRVRTRLGDSSLRSGRHQQQRRPWPGHILLGGLGGGPRTRFSTQKQPAPRMADRCRPCRVGRLLGAEVRPGLHRASVPPGRRASASRPFRSQAPGHWQASMLIRSQHRSSRSSRPSADAMTWADAQ